MNIVGLTTGSDLFPKGWESVWRQVSPATTAIENVQLAWLEDEETTDVLLDRCREDTGKGQEAHHQPFCEAMSSYVRHKGQIEYPVWDEVQVSSMPIRTHVPWEET